MITQDVEGTSTSIARSRLELSCGKEAGHEGPHEDSEHEQRWEAAPGKVATIVRHEHGEQ